MSNNIFYKALAAVSTVGIVVIAASSFAPSINQKDEGINELIEKTKSEVVQARKDALREIRSVKKEALQSLRKESGSKGGGSVWLVMRYEGVNGPALEKVEMVNMTECEFQGAVWQSSTRMNPNEWQGFECIEGK